MSAPQRRILWVVAALALVAGFGLNFVWDPEVPLRIRGPVRSQDPARWLEDGEKTQLVLRYVWEDGTVGRIARAPLPEELAGLSAPELARLRPQWRVESVGPREIVVSQPCQEGQEGFLGVSGGYVAVFDGSPDGCSRLREITDIPLNQLPSFQVADLRKGIPFKDESELALILEGLRVP